MDSIHRVNKFTTSDDLYIDYYCESWNKRFGFLLYDGQSETRGCNRCDTSITATRNGDDFNFKIGKLVNRNGWNNRF